MKGLFYGFWGDPKLVNLPIVLKIVLIINLEQAAAKAKTAVRW